LNDDRDEMSKIKSILDDNAHMLGDLYNFSVIVNDELVKFKDVESISNYENNFVTPILELLHKAKQMSEDFAGIKKDLSECKNQLSKREIIYESIVKNADNIKNNRQILIEHAARTVVEMLDGSDIKDIILNKRNNVENAEKLTDKVLVEGIRGNYIIPYETYARNSNYFAKKNTYRLYEIEHDLFYKRDGKLVNISATDLNDGKLNESLEDKIDRLGEHVIVEQIKSNERWNYISSVSQFISDAKQYDNKNGTNELHTITEQIDA
jgi:hypothetical protein